MLKVAIMQPYFMPYIGYFQLINAVDEFIIYDDVNFINKGWINRNNILAIDKANLFTIPLIGASQNKLINEIEILNDGKWKQKLLKTIEQSYKKAPLFSEFFPFLAEIVQSKENQLSGYIYDSIITICNYLNINTLITKSSSEFNNSDLKAQNRIIDICIKRKATQYINPIGGQELYQRKDFELHDIKLNFIKTNPIQYNQYGKGFVPFLSIIDILMFLDKSEIKEKLNEFELI